MRATLFILSLSVFLIVLVFLLVHSYLKRIRAKRSPYGDWRDLLGRLSTVNRENIAAIALSLADEFGNRREGENSATFDETEKWSMIGGLKGLETLERNCEVLVDLVFYVQQWYPEALAITEQLRLNAREIEWHIGRLKSAAKVGKIETAFPEHAERVVEIYYAMTRCVLTLYDEWDIPGSTELRGVL